MNEDPKFCRQRAEVERRAAAATDLARVQERHQQSAATWDRMAERGEAFLRSRALKAALAN